jgi:hypothetical protein
MLEIQTVQIQEIDASSWTNHFIERPIMLSRKVYLSLLLLSSLVLSSRAAEKPALPLVSDVEFQPFAAQIRRVLEATDFVGAPLKDSDKKALNAALSSADAGASEKIQRILDKYCLLAVNINPESRVKVAQGPAKPELAEHGWRTFLVKVHNEAGVTAELRAVSPNAESVHDSPWKRTKSDEFYRKQRDKTPLKSPSELWCQRI